MTYTEKIKGILNQEGVKRYAKNTGWILFGRVFSLIISFVVTTYVARYLGPLNYGTISYSIGFIGLFSFLANLGIDQVLLRELIKHPEKEHELLGTSLVLKIGSGVATFIIASLATWFIDNNFFVSSLIWIIGLTLIFQPFQIINFYFQSKVQAKKTITTQVIVLITLSFLKLLIIFSGLGIYYFSGIFVIEAILYALFYIYEYQKSSNILSWSYNKSLAHRIIYESWPYMLATAFTVIYTRIDQLMIKHLIGIASVGTYDAAVRVAEMWYFIPGAITTSVFPAIMNAKKTNSDNYEKRLFYLFIGIIGISATLAILIFMFSSSIISILYGDRYLEAIQVLKIYVFGGVSYSVSIALTQYLSAENYKKEIFMSSLVGMVINVILNLLWIPSYGINGAAYATLVAYSIVPFYVITNKSIRKHIFKIIFSPFMHFK